MSDNQDSFYDLPFGKMSQTAKRSCPDDFDKAIDKMISRPDTKPLNRMSQTAKRSCPDDFDKAIDKMISTPDTKPLNSKPKYPTRIVGRATRRLDYQTESPESKSFKNSQWDMFLDQDDQISVLPFESLPLPQNLRRRILQTRRTGLAKRNFNKDFLVDNHLRQLKKRYMCMKSSEKDHGQDLNETSEIIDSNVEAPENSSEDCIEKSDFAKIPKSNSNIDAFTNKETYRKRQKETTVVSSSDNLTQDNQIKQTQDTQQIKLTQDNHQMKPTQDNHQIKLTQDTHQIKLTQDNQQMKLTQDTHQIKLTQVDLQLNSDFLVEEDWHPFYSSTPEEE